MNYRDIIERAVWTFVQGCIGAFTALQAVGKVQLDKQTILAILGGGVAAVISVLKNVVAQKAKA